MAGIVQYVHILTRERGAPDHQVETNKQMVKKTPRSPRKYWRRGE